MDNLITQSTVAAWFLDQEEAIKQTIVTTRLDDTEGREKFYHLYHATQMLRTRFFEEFAEEVSLPSNEYDAPQG